MAPGNGHAAFGDSTPAGERETVGGTRRQQAQRYAAAAEQLPGSEAHAFPFRQQLADGRAGRMLHHDVVGIGDRVAGRRAAQSELVVPSRLEPLVEVADGVEDRAPDEEVRGRAESLRDVTLLPQKAAGIDELGGGRGARQLELYPARD